MLKKKNQEKLDANAEKENRKKEKELRAEKRRAIDRQKDNEIKDKVKREYMTKRKRKIEEFATLKYKYMDQIKTPQQYTEFKSVMDNVTEDMIVNDEVGTYLKRYMDYTTYHHPVMKAKREQDKIKLEREKEDEKKSNNNVSIEIEDGKN